MGIVQRQSIKQSLVTWVGMLTGAANLFYFYPLTLNNEQIGIVQLVIRAAMFFVPIGLLGTHIVAVRYFSRFEQAGQSDGFLGLLFRLTLGGILVWLAVIVIFNGSISTYFAGKSDYFGLYLPFILPLFVLMSLSYLIVVYLTNYKRIAVPAVFWNLLSKITLPVLCMGYMLKQWPFSGIFWGLLLTYVVILLGLVVYMRHLGVQLKLHKSTVIWDTMESRSEFFRFFWYSSFLSISLTILNQLDALLVGSLLDLNQVAVFGLGYFVAEAIDTPRKALLSITGAMVADHLHHNRQVNVAELYREVSINQLIGGGILFVGTMACWQPLLTLMPRGESFSAAQSVILLLGVGRLIDMAGSLNYEIINYSRSYRFLLPVTCTSALITMILHLLLIPRLGIEGAALSTALGALAYTVFKCGIVYFKMGIQPLSRHTLIVVIVIAFCVWLSGLLPHNESAFLDLLWRGALISVFYTAVMYILRVSPSLNAMLEMYYRRFFKPPA